MFQLESVIFNEMGNLNIDYLKGRPKRKYLAFVLITDFDTAFLRTLLSSSHRF